MKSFELQQTKEWHKENEWFELQLMKEWHKGNEKLLNYSRRRNGTKRMNGLNYS
jgi:hypothetical protein